MVLVLSIVGSEVGAMTVLFWRAVFPLWKEDYEYA